MSATIIAPPGPRGGVITPSDDQWGAIKAVAAWYRDRSSPQVFYLAGYAGTGKTTLVPFILDELGLDPTPQVVEVEVDGDNGRSYSRTRRVGAEVITCAFTGKAAKVLARKGAPSPMTVHSAVYTPTETELNRLRELIGEAEIKGDHAGVAELRRDFARIAASKDALKFVVNPAGPAADAGLVILDECSMIGDDMARDLLSFRCKVLAFGDPGQLPPVRGTGYFASRDPDVFLTEIHRQAAENPILRLATMARMGQRIPYAEFGPDVVKVRSSFGLYERLYGEGDWQVLCGTHPTRWGLNRFWRRRMGVAEHEYPRAGERLICTKNNPGKALLNGVFADALISAERLDDVAIGLSVLTEDGAILDDLSVLAAPFEEGFAGVRDFARAPLDHVWAARRECDVFDWGYAITVHKAQGSEWDAVVVCDESGRFRQNAARWLYTAVTRAREKLVIVGQA